MDSLALYNKTRTYVTKLLICVFVSSFCSTVSAIHITGSWNPAEQFFILIAKFGFQQTTHLNQRDSYGYIYGNVTQRRGPHELLSLDEPHHMTLAVLDRGYFLPYYENRSVPNLNEACSRMLANSHSGCSNKEFLRKVPCPKSGHCSDENHPESVVKGSQFSYAIQEMAQPKFWYVSMVACYQNATTCQWHHSNTSNMNIDYDIWLVNGNPNASGYNPLAYQFSFDRQNTLEMYLVFFVWYVVLVPLQLYAATRQSHPVTRLFTASLILEFMAFIFILIHLIKFAMDGRGLPQFAIAGDIFDILSRTIFMLLLLLLAKGWAMTRMELTWKPFVFAVWFLYGVVHILLYVWNKTEVDIVEDIDEYQTWPGWLILSLRTVIMLWFVFELRNTMLYEHNSRKLEFFLHFGASALVWFIYLPIVALIALHVSPLWRFKFLLAITYSADCLAYTVITHLLWPSRSEQYFLLADANPPYGDEMDVFNEAPHEINHHHHHYTPLPTHGSNGELHSFTAASDTKNYFA